MRGIYLFQAGPGAGIHHTRAKQRIENYANNRSECKRRRERVVDVGDVKLTTSWARRTAFEQAVLPLFLHFGLGRFARIQILRWDALGRLRGGEAGSPW